MFKKKEKEVKLVPESTKKKSNVTTFIIIGVVSVVLMLALIIGGSILFNNYQTEKAKEESYKTLVESLNVTFTSDKRLLTIEAAPALTYSSTDALKNVPDQLRNLFASYTGDSTIDVSNLDISTVGDKQVTVTITKTDRFGQVATKQERIIVTVVDTQEPQVDLVSEQIRAENEQEVKANILRVADPVFGYYTYSSSLENHTYRLDLSAIETDKKTGEYLEGVYPVKVEMNDSGNIVERYFDVIVGNPVIEEKVEETTEQTNTTEQVETTENIQVEENTENVEDSGQ